jgi:(p)ppGpp synthase/HD superfamily hydrolase
MAVLATEVEHTPQRTLSTIDDLLRTMRAYLPQADLSLVRRAYEFASHAHEGQTRGTGEPYVQHPLETALLLASLQLDRATVAAGLLHDVPEDSAAGRWRDQAVTDQLGFARRTAGRKPAQDVLGHG